MKNKKYSNHGTNIFSLRQLSSSLGSNAVLIGIIAFFIGFAVIAANISAVEKVFVDASINEDILFDGLVDIDKNDNYEHSISIEEGDKYIKEYAEVVKEIEFTTYTDESDSVYKASGISDDYESPTNKFITLSKANEILSLAGKDTIELDDNQFAILRNYFINGYDFDGKTIDINGETFIFSGDFETVPAFSNAYFVTVIPDEAITGLSEVSHGKVYDFKNADFDERELNNKLSYITHHGSCDYLMSDFEIKEYVRYSMRCSVAILVMCLMYISIVFVMLAMAILAVKTLSGMSDDKKKYEILYKLGTSESERRKTLFKQTFTFFFMPYIIPICLSIPMCIICCKIVETAGYMGFQKPIIGYTLAIDLVITSVYVLYFVATHMLVKMKVMVKG